MDNQTWPTSGSRRFRSDFVEDCGGVAAGRTNVLGGTRRRVGLTTPAVAERVHRLEKLGVIRGFHADISLERLGLPILIYVRLSMAGPESTVRTFQQRVRSGRRFWNATA